MSKKWRPQPTRYFATRPIFKEEIPKLIQAMKEDGLSAFITVEGIHWYHADYRLQKMVVCVMFGVCRHIK